MAIQLSPEPGIYNDISNLNITFTKDSITNEYAYTDNNIPPVVAKYIAYDNLTPANPFIAVVDDGAGRILLDGGFPKWYDQNYNTSWTNKSQFTAAYKYLSVALDYISNPDKVAIGNKKILILGDANSGANYNIKNAGGSYFNNSLTGTINLSGYTSVFKTTSDYGSQLNPTYTELNQYCAIIFFSTVYTSSKLITDSAIEALVSFRENGGGIFFITDHGDNINTLIDATNNTYTGFFRTANHIITRFGCFFTGNYNRTSVSVEFLRNTYGNHPLWENLLDTDSIPAGGSESAVKITEFPLSSQITTNYSLTGNGYKTFKFLLVDQNGNISSQSFTYGINVPELLNFKLNNNIFLPNSITTSKNNIDIDFVCYDNNYNLSGIIKQNVTPIGEFNYNDTTGSTTINYYNGNNKIVQNNDEIILQLISPFSYTKKIKIDRFQPIYSKRSAQYISSLLKNEFQLTAITGSFIKDRKLSIINLYKTLFNLNNNDLKKIKLIKFNEYFQN